MLQYMVEVKKLENFVSKWVRKGASPADQFYFASDGHFAPVDGSHHLKVPPNGQRPAARVPRRQPERGGGVELGANPLEHCGES